MAQRKRLQLSASFLTSHGQHAQVSDAESEVKTWRDSGFEAQTVRVNDKWVVVVGRLHASHATS